MSEFQVYMTATEIQRAIDKLAKQVDDHFLPDDVLDVVILLRAGFIFGVDLVRAMRKDRKMRLHLWEPKRMDTITLGLDQTILVLDTICDSGKTMRRVVGELEDYHSPTKPITTCSLLLRSTSGFTPTVSARLVKEDYWLSGYGLDDASRGENGFNRNLPNIVYHA